ncbi:MAG: efflux RND transporter periplasmic adaptor subunit [Gammaproteobacteria bacterium]|nr:efflux RND transporter periplasmic adaptor subunit [Gammaproteobacteria bacterium]
MNKKHFKWLSIIIIVLAIALITSYFLYFHKAQTKHFMATKPTVALAYAKTTTWKPKIYAIGSITASRGTYISSPVAGIISKINFSSGQKVKTGRVLLTLANQDLQATVDEDAAKYYLAKLQYIRYHKLFKTRVIAQLDIEKYLATMKQDKAQLAHDTANLKKTEITAPFTGILGIRQINLGQYLGAGKPIVEIQDRSTLYVDFSIPEQNITAIKIGNKVTLLAHNNSKKNWQGKIAAIGSALDPTTRSLAIRVAITPPYDNILIPGMYIKVAIPLPSKQQVIVIPQTAVTYNPFGDSVFVYKNGHVTQRTIKIGATIGNNVIIDKGIKNNEQVVVAGQQKLFNNMAVQTTK